MKDNIIKFPIPEVYSPALQAVTNAVDELSDEDTDKLFSYLWAMGYGGNILSEFKMVEVE
ncbi:hypothetical protein [Methylobacter tundripaludum]|uniref:hypothetical protein n=1 Tax=Methylobacter tundripaludum TaxID=173365 RepID=UPI0004DF5F17|nr:hypothetical protein [Methylobacter tundripaludum]